MITLAMFLILACAIILVGGGGFYLHYKLRLLQRVCMALQETQLLLANSNQILIEDLHKRNAAKVVSITPHDA